jgi:ABC-type Na+ efflux pump permease subunit
MAQCDVKKVNIVTAKVIPVILLGVIGYASWVVIRILCSTFDSTLTPIAIYRLLR